MVSGISETANAVGTQIGRYFSLASLLPSLLFVTWLVALSGGGQPLQPFDLSGAASALTNWSWEKVGLVFGAALFLAFAVHPLLFATTQFLEGYWGPRAFAVRLSKVLTMRHRRRQDRLEEQAAILGREIRSILDGISRKEVGDEAFDALSSAAKKERRAIQSASPAGVSIQSRIIARDATKKALAEFPNDADRLLPTRFGNALRRVEDSVGRQYGLDVITIAPHLAVVSAQPRALYVDDTREQLDVSVRLTFFGLLAAALTVIWLLGSGWWLLLALVPYGFAHLTYRGAAASAAEWGTAIATCLDLDRHALYDAMHLERPGNTDEERVRNGQLMKLLRGDRSASVDYFWGSPS